MMMSRRSMLRLCGLLLCAAVPVGCAELAGPKDDVTTTEPERTPAFFAFEYSGAYEGAVEITLDYRDLEYVQPETPGHLAAHAWVEALFMPSSSSPYCTWPAPCPADRWWVVIEAYYPAPGDVQPRFMELRIPSRADGTFGGTYEFACAAPAESWLPECIFTGSIRDEHCASTNGMPLWCLYPDRAGHLHFLLNSQLRADIGFWTASSSDYRGITTARITIDEPIRLTPVGVTQRLRGSFAAVLGGNEQDEGPHVGPSFAEVIQVTNGRFDLEVR